MIEASTFDCTIQSPLGAQKGVMTVVPNTDGSFSGNVEGDLGTMQVENGRIDGNKLTWEMKLTQPMPMDLTAEATVDGDALNGAITAGMFGKMVLSGTRRA